VLIRTSILNTGMQVIESGISTKNRRQHKVMVFVRFQGLFNYRPFSEFKEYDVKLSRCLFYSDGCIC